MAFKSYKENVSARFATEATRDIYNGVTSVAARRALPMDLWRIAQRKLTMILTATRVENLRVPPANRLEKLRGDRDGQYSIRINDQYRVCFRFEGAHATEVEVVDYHR